MLKRRNTQLGFTWVELLVTLAILSVLLSLGVGSWYACRVSYMKRVMLRDVSRAFAYARMDAWLRGETLVFSPKSSSGNWSSGMLLQPQTLGSVYHVWQWSNTGVELTWHGFRGRDDVVVSHMPHHLAMNGYFLVAVHGFPVEQWVVNRFGRIRVLRKHVD